MHCFEGELNKEGHVEVEKRDDESDMDLIHRFEKEVRKADLLIEVKKNQYFIPPSKQRRLKRKRAERRRKRREED